MTTDVAKSGKVMYIPGISKKRRVALTSTHLIYFVCMLMFQSTLSSTNARIPFLQALRGNDKPIFVSPHEGFSIIMPPNNNIIVQYLLMAIVGFFIAYHHLFMVKIKSLKYILSVYLLSFVIVALATMSLPSTGNYSEKTFPKWASERYGVSVQAGDNVSFYKDSQLIKDTDKNVAYELKKVGDKYFLNDLSGKELPIISGN